MPLSISGALGRSKNNDFILYINCAGFPFKIFRLQPLVASELLTEINKYKEIN